MAKTTFGKARTFETGATRDTDEGKYDYEGFLSPQVIERFAAYMHKHQKQSDGNMRASDNWQKGIPVAQYMKSIHRHFMDLWMLHRGVAVGVEKEEILCALMFNVQGMLFEELRGPEDRTEYLNRLMADANDEMDRVTDVPRRVPMGEGPETQDGSERQMAHEEWCKESDVARDIFTTAEEINKTQESSGTEVAPLLEGDKIRITKVVEHELYFVGDTAVVMRGDYGQCGGPLCDFSGNEVVNSDGKWWLELSSGDEFEVVEEIKIGGTE